MKSTTPSVGLCVFSYRRGSVLEGRSERVVQGAGPLQPPPRPQPRAFSGLDRLTTDRFKVRISRRTTFARI